MIMRSFMTFSDQIQYQLFLTRHPDGRISSKSFHKLMKECYPVADTEKLERHIFRMYDTNKADIKLKIPALMRIFPGW